jgi:hypothetical protein
MKKWWLVTYYRTDDARQQMEVFADSIDEADEICYNHDNKYMYSVSVQPLDRPVY